MLNAAGRMKSLGQEAADSGAPTSIFGSAAGLAQTIQADEKYRIGLYPILGAGMPEIAMGLAACLSYLLEQYQDLRVYRCFAKIDSVDSSPEITAADYQFSSADWTLDGLADNVIVEGVLDVAEKRFDLRIDIDNSLSSIDTDSASLTYQLDSLPAMVSALPAIAADIYRKLAEAVNTSAIIEYAPLDEDAAELANLLAALFGWNLDVYLYFWDVEWDETYINDQYREVLELAEKAPSEFAFWTLGMMAKQVMQPGIRDIGESVLPLLVGAFSHERHCAPGAAAAALGMSRMGLVPQAIDFLQAFTSDSIPASVWCAIIEIHLDGGQFEAAIETAQLALERGLRHPSLYWQYAQLLMAAEVNSWNVDDVLLLDPDEYDEDEHLTVEIAMALKLYSDSRRDDLGALQLGLTYMIDAADDEVWIYFERLLQRDEEGMFSGEVVDRLIELDDYDRAYDILEGYVDSNPYAYIYLAQLALADADPALSAEYVAACRGALAEIDDNLELELQRLGLRAALPSFDEQYAEIKVIMSANRPLPENKVDLLEQAIEIAPKLIDLHLLLSACYRSWRDNDSALEVLREAEQRAGVDPQIDLGIAQILWARNERKDAVSQINDALQRFPNDVYLLAQLATYLIENDQLEDARHYVALAETIAPSHRAIWPVRRLVAQKMAQLS